MKLIKKLPFMLFSLIAYNIVALSSETTIADELRTVLFSAALPSGASFSVTLSDALILLGLLLLYMKVLKAVRVAMRNTSDHAFSMLIFVVFLVEFIVYDKCGTATFLILTAIALLDTLVGFTVSLATARRDIAFDGDLN